MDVVQGIGVTKTLITDSLGLNHAVIVDESDRAKSSGGPWLYASSQTDVYRWKYKPGSKEFLPEAETILEEIPSGGHSTRSLAIDVE